MNYDVIVMSLPVNVMSPPVYELQYLTNPIDVSKHFRELLT